MYTATLGPLYKYYALSPHLIVYVKIAKTKIVLKS